MENSSENCENSIESGSESDDSVISISSDDNDNGKLNTSVLFSSETFEGIFTVTFFVCSFFHTSPFTQPLQPHLSLLI